MSKTIEITAVKPLGQSGKVVEVAYSINGNVGKAKAWASDVEAGKTIEVEFEKKANEYQGKTTEETWIKAPKSRGGGFGGGKPDPARAENDRKRIELEEAKRRDFLAKWDKDRKAEAERQASIASQVILKCAVELAVAAGSPSPSDVNAFALDLAETLRQTHDQIFRSIAARADGGQQ